MEAQAINNNKSTRATIDYIKKAEKEQIDIVEKAINSSVEQNDQIIKRYKREVFNLHRALSRIQKDKEQLLAENFRLKEMLNKDK